MEERNPTNIHSFSASNYTIIKKLLGNFFNQTVKINQGQVPGKIYRGCASICWQGHQMLRSQLEYQHKQTFQRDLSLT